MQNFTEYITLAGQRWDTVAYEAYGDVAEVNRIIEANSSVPITATLQEGVRLLIPIVETVAPEVDKTLLPPWRR